jgi:DNA-binding NtrC family response regulator
MTASLLIVDDDRLTRETLASAFADKYQTSVARSGLEALEVLESEKPDVVLSDLRMPDMDGIALLERITQREGTQPSVIFITGHATVEAAVAAMKLGAHDFITKPLNLDRLALMLEKALETRKLREENVELKRSIRESNTRTQLVGESPAMKKILDLAEQVASTDASVLIEGESGTGKELIASLIHYNSQRSNAPFIKINCAAFAEGVLESELFGHERGAFTGAVAARKGRFEMADGGTLFLDEIGDLPLSAQVKLLRFLQERTFERVGGNKTHKVDVRVISATHRNLEELVRTGQFREDLHYRLRVVGITVPPLRERAEDIEPLAMHFVQHFGKIHHRPIGNIADEVMQLMMTHRWSGNVRELMNCVESMVVLTRGKQITLESIPDHMHYVCDAMHAECQGTGILAEMERQAIVDALESTRGNKVEAAKLLGIGLRTLYRKIDKWQL